MSLMDTDLRVCPNGRGHCLCGDSPCGALREQKRLAEKWARDTDYGRRWADPIKTKLREIEAVGMEKGPE